LHDAVAHGLVADQDGQLQLTEHGTAMLAELIAVAETGVLRPLIAGRLD
jgi:hypothetical protein